MKRIISLCIVLVIIIVSFSSCGTKSEIKYAKLAVDEVKSALNKFKESLTIDHVLVETYNPTKDFIPFPNDETSKENYRDVKARVFINYSIGDFSSDCCALINEETHLHFYMTDEQYLQGMADKIAGSDYPELTKSFVLEREHTRNNTYFPSADELKNWKEIDVSRIK